jgi:TonB family protein
MPSPAATVSQETLAAERRLKELEGVVAQLRRERAQMSPGRRPAGAAPTGAARRAPATPPAPAKPHAAAPLVNDVPLPTDLAVSTDTTVAAPLPIAAIEQPPPPPVPRGTMVDVNEPGLTLPVLVTQKPAAYPPRALEQRVTATVSLNALLDETGAVVDISLVRASRRGWGFEDAATSYVRTRVYQPATKQGVPVRVWLPIEVEFRLPRR